MARIQIQIIFEDHFIQVFKYLNISAYHWVAEGGGALGQLEALKLIM